MNSGSSTVLAGAGGGPDKLSRLGDAALGHILSFLPATDAARTATLSRRWRHVFAAVHTLSFGEAEAPFEMRYEWWRCDRCNSDGVRAPSFVTGVTTALNGRHRGARAATTPLRALRVAFDDFGLRGGAEATKAVDGWLSYAVHSADEELEVDLRLGAEPICDSAYALVCGGPGDGTKHEVDSRARHDATNLDMQYEMAEGQDDHASHSDDGGSATIDDSFSAAAAADDFASAASDDYNEPNPGEYVVPRSLFSSCAVLRALRLGRCCIDLPSTIALPSLNTLHLTSVTGRRGGAIQRLVSACPSLVDLTLEACENLTALAVDGARLRRLALRCCHQLGTVTVGTPELRAFEYRGAIPPASFLVMHAHAAPRRISFCDLDFCGVERGAQLFGLKALLAGVDRLHLTSARLGSCFVSHGGGGVSPYLPMLRNLEITGMLPDDDESAVSTVARILERTPRLETLSLFFLPEPHPVKIDNPYYVSINKEVLNASHELRYDPHARLAVPRDVEIPSCLRETTMEINFVHYQGSAAQRALARFLLCNAPVVGEVCWKVARGPLSIQKKLMQEVRGWLMNKSANMIFF